MQPQPQPQDLYTSVSQYTVIVPIISIIHPSTTIILSSISYAHTGGTEPTVWYEARRSFGLTILGILVMTLATIVIIVSRSGVEVSAKVLKAIRPRWVYCVRCGKHISAGVTRCRYCGNEQVVIKQAVLLGEEETEGA